MPTPTYPISLCMIVRDEARFLADALASVAGVVAEICVVDTGSTDDTIAIAQSFGARIKSVAWRDDFAWARNQALDMATQPWILVLDADERLAPHSRDAVIALHGVRPDRLGRWIQCRNFSDGKRELVGSTNAIVRIFPRDPAIRYRGALHEYVARDGEEQSLRGAVTSIEIHHYGYLPEIMIERDKGGRNLRVSEASLAAGPDDPILVYNYAMSALLAGDRDLGREQLERVVELTRSKPRGFRPMALATLAGLYVETGRAAEALTLAEECAGLVKDYPDAEFARGRALAGLERYDEARAAFGAAIAAGTDDRFEHFVVDDQIAAWKAHNEIGGTLVAQGRYAEALQWLELALGNHPAERTLILNRARCHEALGDEENALVGFRAVFDGFHDENAAIEYVNFVFRHGSPDISLLAVEQALPIVGLDYQRAFLVSAAAAMLRAGRPSDARGLLERTVRMGRDPSVGLAIIESLAQQFGLPELNDLLTSPGGSNDFITAP